MRFWLGFLVELGLWTGGHLGHAVDSIGNAHGRYRAG